MPLWIVSCETTSFKWMEKILLYLFFNQSVFEWVCFALQQIPHVLSFDTNPCLGMLQRQQPVESTEEAKPSLWLMLRDNQLHS